MKKELRLQKVETLKELLKGTNKRLTFSNLKPSQSGMSRTFNIHIIKDNQIIERLNVFKKVFLSTTIM